MIVKIDKNIIIDSNGIISLFNNITVYNYTSLPANITNGVYILANNQLYYGKPILYSDTSLSQEDIHIQYMYPNEARLRNLTYGFTIHYDLVIEPENENENEHENMNEKNHDSEQNNIIKKK